jgi:hypothetical protein
MYVRLLQQLGKDLSHTHPKKYPECMDFLFIRMDTAWWLVYLGRMPPKEIMEVMQNESHHFKEAHTYDGS